MKTEHIKHILCRLLEAHKTVMTFQSCIVIAVCLTFFLFPACQKTSSETGNTMITIVTTLFPTYDFTRNIADNKVDLHLLVPPGVEPHSFEPKPSDIVRINSADIFIYTGKHMEPWVEGLLKSIDNKKLIIVDASKNIVLRKFFDREHNSSHHQKEKHPRGDIHDHGAYDPHIWLDFVNAQQMVDTILEAIISRDPVNGTFYTNNAVQYKKKLAELDTRYRETLSRCHNKVLVHGGHYAFGYLANRYRLLYISAYKGSPNAEPSPKHIAVMKRIIDEHKVNYIYYEELITPRIAHVLSRETGATLLMLHGAHNISKADFQDKVTFLSLMDKNLENLAKGLRCAIK